MSRSDTARIDRGQQLVGQGVEKAYTQADFGRFPASPLETLNASLRVNPATAQSAFLGNMANPLAGSFQLQRMPGAQYANYERMAPNIGGPLTAPQVPAGFVPPGTQPEVIRQYPDGTPVGDEEEVDTFDPSDPLANAQSFLDDINRERESKGLAPFNTIQEYIADQIGDIGIGSIGMAEGGIASLEPMYMSAGGIMGALSSLGSGIGGALTGAGGAIGNALGGIGGGIGRGIEALGGLAQQGLENYQANQKRQEEKRLEDMTREELLEYIRSGGKKSSASGFNVEGIRNLFSMGGNDPMENATPPINAMTFAGGGDVDFPRMNGPISGPGTETSDDIPAMLSDGEFVVNAKAVRGIGRLEGAGKSKEEQRREGARMMYALQRAGEKAMRKA
jgi:hypothetical protein